MTERRRLAEFWLEQGFAVLPLHGNKAPVSHLVPRGWHDATKDPTQLWQFDHDDTKLVGIVPGTAGFLVLDVDVKSAVDGSLGLKKLLEKFGPLGARKVRTPSGGFHLYLKKRADETVGNADLVPGVNVRSNAGYVVAPGNPGGYDALPVYEIENAPEAPPWLVERLRANALADEREEAYEAPEARLEEDWDHRVQEAFDLFDPYGDRHTSVLSATAALASHELLGYAGATAALRDLESKFIEAVKDDRGGEAAARREYRRALDGGRHRVKQNVSIGLEERDKTDLFLKAIIRDNGGTDEDIEKVINRIHEQPDRMKLWAMDELLSSDLSVNWLVRNVLITPTYGQIAGESKTLKTYLSQYLALAVSTGTPFLGHFPVSQEGKVVFFVGEGGRIPWTRRLPRIGRSVGLDDVSEAPIYAAFETAPILSPRFKNTVTDALEKIDPVLTILDPLYAFHGADTNSANLHEEGALLTAVAEPFVEHGSTLLLLNHFNKGSGRNMKRITMSGSGEWIDSWFFTESRMDPNLATGDFYISVEFGSRQWGGSRWDLDFSIGSSNSMGMESEDPITIEVRKNWD